MVSAFLGDGATPTRRLSAKFHLPLHAAPTSQFAIKAGEILRDSRTRVYVDTSLLTWLTKIGPTSRQQFLEWLEECCSDRLFVPAWAAHEFYRHHVNGTVAKELSDHIGSLKKISAESYALLHPFLDQLQDNASAKRSRVREALAALSGITEVFDDLQKNDNHAAEVIAFINLHAMPQSSIFENLNGIEGLAEARFTGRIPPGFQDRNKKAAVTSDEEGLIETGTNRWGDLMFWHEILQDARLEKPQAIVILTRDSKNDWRMGGLLQPEEPEAKSKGSSEAPQEKIESPVHPTLSFEALRIAGVDKVLLLDNSRLAAIAKSEGVASSFVGVAISPAPIQPKTEKTIRKEEVDLRTRYEAEAEKKLASRSGYRFLDPPGMTAHPTKLNLLLLQTRKALAGPVSAECVDAEAKLATIITGDDNIEAVLNREVVEKLGSEGFMMFIRRLGERALIEPGYDIMAADTIAMLDKLPPATASHAYLGLLAAMYLKEGNKSRIAPQSPVASQLVKLRTESYAKCPIQALGAIVAKQERRPIYFPTVNGAAMPAQFYADSDVEPRNQLVSLWIGGQQLLTEDQGDEALRFSGRFDKSAITAQEAVEFASELFHFPIALIAPNVHFDAEFTVTPFLGYKAPNEIWVADNKENEDG